MTGLSGFAVSLPVSDAELTDVFVVVRQSLVLDLLLNPKTFSLSTLLPGWSFLSLCWPYLAALRWRSCRGQVRMKADCIRTTIKTPTAAFRWHRTVSVARENGMQMDVFITS